MTRLQTSALAQTLLANATGDVRSALLAAANPALATEIEKVKKRPGRIKQLRSEDATTLVAELSDPELLRDLAAVETRIGVRGAILSNEHCPRDVPSSPGARVRKGKDPLGEALQGDVETVLAQVQRLGNDADWDRVLSWAHQSSEAKRAVLHLAGASTEAAFLALVQAAQHEGPATLDEVLGAVPARSRRHLLTRTVLAVREASETLVKRAIEEGSELPERQEYTPAAVLVMLQSTRMGDRAAALVTGSVPVAEAVEVFKTFDGWHQNHTVTSTESFEHVDAYAVHLTYQQSSGFSGGDPTGLLDRHSELSTEGRLRALRYASAGEVGTFLEGGYAAAPRPGEGREVAEMFLSDVPAYTTSSTLIAELGSRSGRNPAFHEFCETVLHHGKGVVASALSRGGNGTLQKRAYDLLVQTCQDKKERWEVVLTLAPTWEGTLEELLEAATTVTTRTGT